MITRIDPLPLEKVRDRIHATACVVLTLVNYEHRSTAYLREILPTLQPGGRQHPAKVGILWPQGTTGRVELLESLKQLQQDEIQPLLRDVEHTNHVLNYPQDFNERQVTEIVAQLTGHDPNIRPTIVIDISCMPRRILITVCAAIRKVLADEFEVYCVYTSPERYASLRYAQDIGVLTGYFSGVPLHQVDSAELAILLFPGMQGFEGKVMHDFAGRHPRGKLSAFFAGGGEDYHSALTAMRANQALFEHPGVDLVYYFSLSDGIKKLQQRINHERILTARAMEAGSSDARTVVAASFGPKVFTLASFMYLQDLHEEYPHVAVDFAQVSGFQYLSLYSLGTGTTKAFRLSAASQTQ